MWWLAAAAGAQAVGSFINAQKQAKSQEQVAEEQARRFAAQNAQTLGEAGAVEGASGLVVGGSSLSKHIADMAAEFRRQESWALQAGLAGAEATRQASYWGAAGDVSAMLFRYGQATNWGKAPSTTQTRTPYGSAHW